MKIGLFVTCLNDSLYPSTGKAVVAVLERLGHEIVFPSDQTCCGQMHLNTGYRSEATALAKKLLRTFSDVELIVSPSASCVGTIHDMYSYLAEIDGDQKFAQEVDLLSKRIFEFSQLLVDVLGLTDVGAYFPQKVAYHPTCHSLRGLHLGDGPVQLLRSVKGLELLPLVRADSCCGFGGTFSIKNADTSTSILEDKLQWVHASGAEVLSATDNSCLMHIGGGLSRIGSSVKTLHLAEILSFTDTEELR